MQYSKQDIDQWDLEDAADDETMTPEQRLAAAFQLFDLYRDTMFGVLRGRHPHASNAEVDRMFLDMIEDSESDRDAA